MRGISAGRALNPMRKPELQRGVITAARAGVVVWRDSQKPQAAQGNARFSIRGCPPDDRGKAFHANPYRPQVPRLTDPVKRHGPRRRTRQIPQKKEGVSGEFIPLTFCPLAGTCRSSSASGNCIA